jgi:hypothetical protein
LKGALLLLVLPFLLGAALLTWVSCRGTQEPQVHGDPSPAAPPANLSLTVYARSSATSYQPDGPFGATPVANASVQLGSTVIGTTTPAGTTSGSTFETGYQTLSVNSSEFIPMLYPDNIVAGPTNQMSVGMYALPPVIPRPGFAKGVALWDAGGWTESVFLKNGSFLSTIRKVHESTSANVVAFSDTANAQGNTASTLTISSSAQGSYWGMLTPADYASIVAGAHSSGLAFMMMLSVYSLDSSYSGTVWNVPASDGAFWDQWFRQYTNVVTQYAAVAGSLGVEYLSVGLNMGYASRTSAARWRALIAAIRDAGYTGRIGYFGFTDPTTGFYENDAYAPGFVELFDFIGVDVYTVTTTAHPSRDQLVAGWRLIEDRASRIGKPVFIMIGTPSTDLGASDPTYIEPAYVVDHVADRYRRDYFQQADVYEAAFETIDARPAGDGIAGLFSWGYYYQDNYRDLMQPGDMAVDKAASIRNKPAQAILRWWFDRL